MELAQSLNRLGKKDVIVKAIIWKSFCDIFAEKKKSSFAPFLQSIQIRGNKIIVTTRKASINFELKLMEKEILQSIEKKTTKMGFSYKTWQIVYR